MSAAACCRAGADASAAVTVSSTASGTLQSGRRLTLGLVTTLTGHSLPVNDIVVPRQGSSVGPHAFVHTITRTITHECSVTHTHLHTCRRMYIHRARALRSEDGTRGCHAALPHASSYSLRTCGSPLPVPGPVRLLGWHVSSLDHCDRGICGAAWPGSHHCRQQGRRVMYFGPGNSLFVLPHAHTYRPHHIPHTPKHMPTYLRVGRDQVWKQAPQPNGPAARGRPVAVQGCRPGHR